MLCYNKKDLFIKTNAARKTATFRYLMSHLNFHILFVNLYLGYSFIERAFIGTYWAQRSSAACIWCVMRNWWVVVTSQCWPDAAWFDPRTDKPPTPAGEPLRLLINRFEFPEKRKSWSSAFLQDKIRTYEQILSPAASIWSTSRVQKLVVKFCTRFCKN